MLTEKEIWKIWEDAGAILQDSHVVYASGKHGSQYVNKDALYPHPEIISKLCREIALRFLEAKPQAVVAPALGGIILCQWVAHHLNALGSSEVLAIYAEKDEAGFIIKRGYDQLLKGKRVLVLEDILTTGGSVKKVVETVRKIPAEVIAVAALCNRGNVQAGDVGDVPELQSLFSLSLQTYDATQCPLCLQKVPINTSVGKGRDFLAQNK